MITFPIPEVLKPYYEEALKSVHPLEVTASHELNRFAAERRLNKYKTETTGDKFPQSSENEVNAFMMHEKAIEKATLAYRRIEHEKQAKLDRSIWLSNNTCPYCGQVENLNVRYVGGVSIGRCCQDCHEVAESMRIEKLKTKERIKALGAIL